MSCCTVKTEKLCECLSPAPRVPGDRPPSQSIVFGRPKQDVRGCEARKRPHFIRVTKEVPNGLEKVLGVGVSLGKHQDGVWLMSRGRCVGLLKQVHEMKTQRHLRMNLVQGSPASVE